MPLSKGVYIHVGIFILFDYGREGYVKKARDIPGTTSLDLAQGSVIGTAVQSLL